MRSSNGCRLLVIFAIISSFASRGAADEPASIAWHRDLDQAWQAVQESRRPLLLFVTMEGCHYCHKMARETFRDPEVMADVKHAYVAATTSKSEQRELVRRLHIRAYPTTLIISPSGEVTRSIRGFAGPQQLQQALRAGTHDRLTQR